MLKTIRSEIGDLGWIIRTLAMAAVAGALYRELRLPPEERTWHGKLLNFVPYDFRVPTPAKFVQAYWNPKSSQIVGDPPFGVGWSLNVAALADKVQGFGADGSKRSRTTARKARKAAA